MADRDPLGKLQGTFSGKARGRWGVVLGVLLLPVGVALIVGSGSIAAALFNDADEYGPYVYAGAVVCVLAGLIVLVGLYLMSEAFEVRRKGVRHRTWLYRRELRWAEIDAIDVRKHTVVYNQTGTARRSWYKIRIEGAGGTIKLGAAFLEAASPIQVIVMLKLHMGQAVVGDADDIRVPRRLQDQLDADDDRTARGKKKKAAPAIRYQDVAERLAAGEPAPAVEAWLTASGVAPAAAAALIDKALANRSRQAAAGAADTPENEARRQLARGVAADRVEAWLRDQGWSAALAKATVANLREERL